MKVVGWVLIAASVIAVAQALAAVMVLALLAALIWALMKAPRELFGLFGLGILAGIVHQQPLACLALATLTLILGRSRRISTIP
jgi:quinol-cytochrome oxidoreductase complex cytochrome b subunit